eukprot:GHVS01051184.1.p1 GENE.GHVS01051184.1~~GHVS01051184.1.p1  ORF type:complete len:499 (+),score=87.11 GHVS01051184.1:344-1840(+)
MSSSPTSPMKSPVLSTCVTSHTPCEEEETHASTPRVVCFFDPTHRMRAVSYLEHLRHHCAAFTKLTKGVDYWQCPYEFSHFFRTEQEKTSHLPTCASRRFGCFDLLKEPNRNHRESQQARTMEQHLARKYKGGRKEKKVEKIGMIGGTTAVCTQKPSCLEKEEQEEEDRKARQERRSARKVLQGLSPLGGERWHPTVENDVAAAAASQEGADGRRQGGNKSYTDNSMLRKSRRHKKTSNESCRAPEACTQWGVSDHLHSAPPSGATSIRPSPNNTTVDGQRIIDGKVWLMGRPGNQFIPPPPPYPRSSDLLGPPPPPRPPPLPLLPPQLSLQPVYTCGTAVNNTTPRTTAFYHINYDNGSSSSSSFMTAEQQQPLVYGPNTTTVNMMYPHQFETPQWCGPYVQQPSQLHLSPFHYSAVESLPPPTAHLATSSQRCTYSYYPDAAGVQEERQEGQQPDSEPEDEALEPAANQPFGLPTCCSMFPPPPSFNPPVRRQHQM